MRKITAIAILTIKAALRSRVFAAAALAIAVVIIGLPFVIKGDGSPESQAGIFINYAFGLLLVVLSLTATWCGAGAISLEISGRQMQGLVTKPLRSIQIWIGKLLGLMTLNLVLLALGGVLIGLMLNWTIRGAKINQADKYDLHRKIMTVYRTVAPSKTPNVQGGPVAISPGQSGRWDFDLTQYKTLTPFALLKFRIIPSPFSHQSPVNGNWRAAIASNPDFFSETSAISPYKTIYLDLPAIQTPGRLTLEYSNRQTNRAVTVFFQSENDVSLLMPESSFEANLLRGLIMGFARLTFFTSLGMLAGTLFTFPVAVFVAMGLLAMAFSGGVVNQLARQGLLLDAAPEQLTPLAAGLNDLVRGLFRFCAVVFPPLDRFDPLAFLPDSLFIPWSLVGQALLVLCGLYALVLILAGAACLSRREIGSAVE